MPVGPISTTGSPGSSSVQRSDEPPISSTIVETSPLLGVDPGARECQPLHREARSVDGLRQRLEILQAVELPGTKAARRRGSADDDLDDRRRQPFDAHERRAELVVEMREKAASLASDAGATLSRRRETIG